MTLRIAQEESQWSREILLSDELLDAFEGESAESTPKTPKKRRTSDVLHSPKTFSQKFVVPSGDGLSFRMLSVYIEKARATTHAVFYHDSQPPMQLENTLPTTI